MKPRLTNIANRPLFASMIMESNPEDSIVRFRKSAYDGADLYAVHLEYLDEAYHNCDTLKRIFDYAGNKPVYTMYYRTAQNAHISEEEHVRVQMEAARAGASMVDMMGDIYNPSPRQLAMDPQTISRQRRMIDGFHSLDCEVMLSSHTWCFMTAEETLDHCDALVRRGADLVKIAMCAFEEDQMEEVYRTTRLMNKQLKVPFLHVCMGQYGKLHRLMAGTLGSCMVLCMQDYVPVANKEQPLLRAARAVYANMDWQPGRDDRVGAYLPQ